MNKSINNRKVQNNRTIQFSETQTHKPSWLTSRRAFLPPLQPGRFAKPRRKSVWVWHYRPWGAAKVSLLEKEAETINLQQKTVISQQQRKKVVKERTFSLSTQGKHRKGKGYQGMCQDCKNFVKKKKEGKCWRNDKGKNENERRRRVSNCHPQSIIFLSVSLSIHMQGLCFAIFRGWENLE